MDANTINVLKQLNKLYPEAKQKLKELDPEFKVPAGTFEGKIKSFEFKVIKGKAAIERKFTVTNHPDKQYNGCTISDLMWPTTPGGIAFAYAMFVSVGIIEAKKMGDANELPRFCSIAGKINSVFVLQLKYEKYQDRENAKVGILRRKENVETVTEEPQENVVEELAETTQPEIIEDAVTETIPETIDDFKTDEPPFYDDNDPTLDSVPTLPIKKKPDEVGKFEKHRKKLIEFIIAYYGAKKVTDIEMKTTGQLIDFVKENEVDFSDLSRPEKTLLKKVEIVE